MKFERETHLSAGDLARCWDTLLGVLSIGWTPPLAARGGTSSRPSDDGALVFDLLIHGTFSPIGNECGPLDNHIADIGQHQEEKASLGSVIKTAKIPCCFCNLKNNSKVLYSSEFRHCLGMTLLDGLQWAALDRPFSWQPH